MARQCQITQAKPVKGRTIIRSGKAKKKGGIGMHVTANTPRQFFPNLRTQKIYVPELKKHVSVKLTARALKTVVRKGAYQTLRKAGLI